MSTPDDDGRPVGLPDLAFDTGNIAPKSSGPRPTGEVEIPVFRRAIRRVQRSTQLAGPESSGPMVPIWTFLS
jgi:hypothetical protein